MEIRSIELRAINISSTPTPVANFSASTVSGVAPLSVTFTDNSTNDPTSWAWDFDNSGNTDSTSQNPTYVYSTAGTYSVKLTATNLGGSNTLVRTNYITVTDSPPVANFSASPLIGQPPLSVTFTDNSTNGPTSWAWDFDNSGNTDSTSQNPTYVYNSVGTYSVKLTATNSGGSNTLIRTNYVIAAVPLTGTATYTIGTGGSGGSGAANGTSGTSTTFSYANTTITGGGGGSGRYNNGANGTGGTFSGGDGGANGGIGGGVSGDQGGGGGGGVGGTALPSRVSVAFGGNGAALTNVANLTTALTALGLNFTSVGVGANSSSTPTNGKNGGNATGVGCGGGGAGYYGGNGGSGFRGGGGGGAAGYGATQVGGAGGDGIIIIQRITDGNVVYEQLTSGTSATYNIPANTLSITVWAIGGGGGGAGAIASDTTSGGGGGAGGTAYKTWINS